MKFLTFLLICFSLHGQSQLLTAFGGLNVTVTNWEQTPSFSASPQYDFVLGVDGRIAVSEVSSLRKMRFGLGTRLAYLRSTFFPPSIVSTIDPLSQGAFNFTPYVFYYFKINTANEIRISPIAGVDLRFGKSIETNGFKSNGTHFGWAFGGSLSIFKKEQLIFGDFKPDAIKDPSRYRRQSIIKGLNLEYRLVINENDLSHFSMSGGYFGHNVTLGLVFGSTVNVAVARKPALYFYPEAIIDSITLSVTPAGKLTYTYPSFNKDITFSAKPNGELTHKDLNLDYLFFESTYHGSFEKSIYEQGELVSEENYLTFLETQLTLLGLNDKEKQQFITYWMPELIQHKKVFIRLLMNEECDLIARINVNPKPQNINRVYMLFKPDPKEDILPKKQLLTPFDRSGFDVLEWGGLEIPEQETDL